MHIKYSVPDILAHMDCSMCFLYSVVTSLLLIKFLDTFLIMHKQ